MKDDRYIGISYDNFSKKVSRFGEKHLDFSSNKPNYNKITLKITKEKIISYLNDEYIMEELNIIPYNSLKPNRIGIRICKSGKLNVEKIEVVKYSTTAKLDDILKRDH